jgi:hypothetical protein
MSLVTDSDEYTFGVNSDGLYVNQIPNFNNHPQGIRCPCNNHVFHARANFVTHIKSDRHTKYIDYLNANRGNHAAELDTARQNIKEYKIIIARMERTIAGLERDKLDLFRTINLLTNMTTTRTDAAPDLINFVD